MLRALSRTLSVGSHFHVLAWFQQPEFGILWKASTLEHILLFENMEKHIQQTETKPNDYGEVSWQHLSTDSMHLSIYLIFLCICTYIYILCLYIYIYIYMYIYVYIYIYICQSISILYSQYYNMPILHRYLYLYTLHSLSLLIGPQFSLRPRTQRDELQKPPDKQVPWCH